MKIMIKNTHSADSKHISELDSLRGVAIVLVLTYHVYFQFFKPHITNFNNKLINVFLFVAEGHTGVSLFFILSAFLLSQPFLKELTEGYHVSKKKFYKRRFLRIMPLYCISVVSGMIYCYDHSDVVIKGIKALLFIPGSGGLELYPFSGPWWSLETEIHFYVILPLFFMGLKSHPLRKLTCLILFIYVMSYLLFIFKIIHIPNIKYLIILAHTLFGRLPVFALGIVSAMIYLTYGQEIKIRLENSSWAKRFPIGDFILFLCLIFLGCLLYQVNRIGYFKADHLYLFWHIFEGMIWAGITLLFLLFPFRTKPLFCNSKLSYLGTISYSIYLWHYPIIVLGEKINLILGKNILDNTPYFIFSFIPLLLIVIILISTLSYRYIELPFLLKKAKI